MDFLEKRSSVAAPSRADEEEDYVPKSEYEMDFEAEEVFKLEAHQHGQGLPRHFSHADNLLNKAMDEQDFVKYGLM